MIRNRTGWLIATGLAAVTACAGTSRGVETYRADTSKLLESREPQLKSCYDDALKADGKLAGTVTVQFIIENKTGMVVNAAVQPDHTTAPAILGQCVLKAVDGLVLAPPDRNEGRATFVYEFKRSSPAGAPTS
jgi:hypothetical protein